MNKRCILFFLILLSFLQVHAKTKRFGTWIEAKFSKDIFKKLEFTLAPELRLQDDFTVDEYLMDGDLTFKPVDFLRLSAAYRYLINVKKSENEHYHRFALDAMGKKEWKRLEGSLRFRLTNYPEFEANNNDKNEYLRYRLKFEYDIRKCKLRPFTSYELFYLLADKALTKSRFDIEGSYKISDNSRLGLYYRLETHFDGEDAIHILGIAYDLDF
jgi:hypothetical protein